MSARESNLKKWFATAAILALIAACGEKKPAMPPQQIEFCNAVNKYRDAYAAEADKEFYIDKETKLASIFSERTTKLIRILGEGNIVDWSGTINKITPIKDGAFLEVTLPCQVELKPQDNLIIKINTPLYESLRSFHEKSEIRFSGSLLVSPTKVPSAFPYKAYYGETSFSESGSMREPELLFMFKEIK
jgi:predicted small lipoprotein YifL